MGNAVQIQNFVKNSFSRLPPAQNTQFKVEQLAVALFFRETGMFPKYL